MKGDANDAGDTTSRRELVSNDFGPAQLCGCGRLRAAAGHERRRHYVLCTTAAAAAAAATAAGRIKGRNTVTVLQCGFEG